MGGEIMWIYIIIAIIVLIVIYALALYNSFVKLNNKVKEAFSTMDVYLKKRWDLIPNIVEIVKGYAKHEKDTLKEVVELRNSTYDKMSDEEKIKTNEQLSSGINKIMALAEAYPDLKANENFKDLSKQLTKVEDDITNSRKYYNGVVRIYNNKVEMFPSNIFAGLFGYKSKAMFEASANERENVKVEL
jgi:LemA protein